MAFAIPPTKWLIQSLAKCKAVESRKQSVCGTLSGCRSRKKNVHCYKESICSQACWLPVLGSVSGAINHQLPSHLCTSPETWAFFSRLVDCLARNQTSWIFSFLNVSSFIRSADKRLSTSMCVSLSVCLSQLKTESTWTHRGQGMWAASAAHTGDTGHTGQQQWGEIKTRQHPANSLEDPSYIFGLDWGLNWFFTIG